MKPVATDASPGNPESRNLIRGKAELAEKPET